MERVDDTKVVSLFFANTSPMDAEEKANNDVCDDFLNLIDELNNSLKEFAVPLPVTCIYNSTEYARNTFEQYVRKYCNTSKSVMYLGINPGPWGMSQTGVPFGEVNAVRDWLGIQGPVGKPARELKARPVKGFDCRRSEISGKRFWGLFKDLCGVPDNFFRTSFVYNYLPQQWMKDSGCNVTPGDFKPSQMKDLYNICDPILCKVLELYEVETIVAVGKICETRAKQSLKRYLPSSNIKIVCLLHPSPRCGNSDNWSNKAICQLNNFGLIQYYTSGNISTSTI